VETLTRIQMHAGELFQARAAEQDTSEEQQNLNDTKDEAKQIMRQIMRKYDCITMNDYKTAMLNIVKNYQSPQDVIDLINAKIDEKYVNDGTITAHITAHGKRKRIKRKTHKHRNSKRIKRKSHRRSYRNKKM
jgi:hypothetical protein